MKRALCKKCCSLLVPGVTATSRQRRKSPRHGAMWSHNIFTAVSVIFIHRVKPSVMFGLLTLSVLPFSQRKKQPDTLHSGAVPQLWAQKDAPEQPRASSVGRPA